MKLLIVVMCVIVGALAIPVQPQDHQLQKENHDQIVIVAKDPTKRAELVRKARQIYEDINIDIIQSGGGGYNQGYGGYGGYYNQGYGGYNGYNQGYGGYNQGYGGYGGYAPNGYGYVNGFFG